MAKKKSGLVRASGWLFILGIIVSIIAGLFPTIDPTAVASVLAILGFIIGLLGIAGVGSIDKTETNMFLLAVVALMAAGGAGAAFARLPEPLGSYLMSIVNYIGILVVPAAVLMALEAIWRSGSTKF